MLISLPVIAKQPAERQPPTIPQMIAADYVGSDLKIKETLAITPAYKRYLISYKSGKLNISGIMNVPVGKGPFPVLVLCHGYINPKIYTVGRGLKREQDYLARQGFVVLHTDYRNHGLSDKDPGSEQHMQLGYVEDVVSAVLAVKNSKFDFIDKERVGLMGHSLGGGICEDIMVAKPNLVKAIVLYSPVSADYIDNFNRWIVKDRPDIAADFMKAHGTPQANPQFWKELSAINYLDRISVPIMINHGTNDQDCPLAWSQRLAAALQAAGKSVEFN